MKLEIYEEICPECNGIYEYGNFYRCSTCNDRGKIDWIDKIKGQKECVWCAGYGRDLEGAICLNCGGSGYVGYDKDYYGKV